MSDFFNELKRRNVFRVGVAYLVAGWVILQVVDIIAGPLGLPVWFATAVIVALGVGLPVALLLAWAFELTPEGVKRSDDVDPDASVTHETGRKLNWVVAGALIVALAYIGSTWFRGSTRLPAGDLDSSADRSIAVLPFADMSPGGGQEWFGDGVADEILHILAQSGELKVISRSSSFAFRGDGVDIRSAAAQLGARFILEGSVTRAEDRVRVIAQLIDSQSDSHVWSETFSRELSDIFAVQQDIATRIAEALSINLGVARQATTPPSTETYDLILRARAAKMDRSAEGIFEAVSLLQEAAELSPNSADVLGELAMALLLVRYWTGGSLTPEQVEASWRGAELAADAALAINPTDVEALVARATLYTNRYDFEEAETLYQRALEVSPGSALVYNWYGDLLQFWDRGEEAVEAEGKAAELDPLQPANHHNLSDAYRMVADWESALVSRRRSVELSPGVLQFQVDLIVALYSAGEFDEMESVARALPDELGRQAGAVAPILSEIGRGVEAAHSDLASWLESLGEAGQSGAAPSEDSRVRLLASRVLLAVGDLDLWASLQPPNTGTYLPWAGCCPTDAATFAEHPVYAAFWQSPPRDKLVAARRRWARAHDRP